MRTPPHPLPRAERTERTDPRSRSGAPPGRLTRALASLATTLGLAARRPAALLASAALTFTVSPQTVFAQTAPQVTSQASETEVEVGEAFTVQLKAMSETAETVSAPELRPPAGFSISGPMISTQTFMQFGTGGRKTMSGIGATWSLVASAPGNFTIPAPSVEWEGKRLRATPMSIKVVPQGSKPRRQPGGFLFPGGQPGGSPFGSNWPFPGFDIDEPDDPSGGDPSLALPRAPANDVFLHAVVDKKRAVVGEQITVSIYRYFQPRAFVGNPGPTPMRLEDFVRYSLVGDGATQASLTAVAGGKSFRVRLIDRYAIMPLKAGSLATGSYVESYVAYNRRTTFVRQSENLGIQVTEPPVANRPVGYRLGDVGQFQISALVQPRKITEGGSVAALVKVTGTGNFPSSLNLPEKTGVEWLDPEKKEQIEPRNGEISGFRSFGHVVRLTRTGTVDLGTIELPYWNPRAKRYEVARTALGTVEVTPSPVPTPSPSSTPTPGEPARPEEPFSTLPTPRSALSAFSPPTESTILPGAAFPIALGLPPFLALAGIASMDAARRARSRLAERKTSPRTLATAALADAKRAKAAGDERAASSAIERATVLAIEAATGVKARGVLKDQLAAELTANGLPEGVAARAQEMLAACDRARFDPLAAADVQIAEAEALVTDLLRAKGP